MRKGNWEKITISVLLVALLVIAGLAATGIAGVGKGTPAPTAPALAAKLGTPVIVIEKSHVLKLDKNSKLMIMGSGFPPGKEVHLVISQADGSLSDITDLLDPKGLKANEFGVWATAWTAGNYTRGSLAAADVFALLATDAEYNVLASTPFGYYSAKDDYAKWPSWAKVVVPSPTPKATK